MLSASGVDGVISKFGADLIETIGQVERFLAGEKTNLPKGRRKFHGGNTQMPHANLAGIDLLKQGVDRGMNIALGVGWEGEGAGIIVRGVIDIAQFDRDPSGDLVLLAKLLADALQQIVKCALQEILVDRVGVESGFAADRFLEFALAAPRDCRSRGRSRTTRCRGRRIAQSAPSAAPSADRQPYGRQARPASPRFCGRYWESGAPEVSGSIAWARVSLMTVRPSGLRILQAILANILEVEIPTEQRILSRSLILSLSDCPNSRTVRIGSGNR